MMAPRGIVVCVGFDDLLSITLPRNMRHMVECLVVTSPEDERTKALARSVPGVKVFETDAFSRHGAKFNKGLAMEEAFDHYGRTGWLLIWDADILMPPEVDFRAVVFGKLNGCNRVFLDDPTKWSPEMTWNQQRPYREPVGLGFFQLFHADSPRIKDQRPWYDVHFAHAGSCDAHFVELWSPRLLHRLPFNCLHIGPSATNWYQRVSPRLDGEPIKDRDDNAKHMARYLKWSEWGPNGTGLRFDNLGDEPPLNRVDVPGYAPSEYEPPHIRQKGMKVKRGFFA